MDIGTSIAIASAWIFAGMMALSNSVSGLGLWVGIFVAAAVTAVLLILV